MKKDLIRLKKFYKIRKRLERKIESSKSKGCVPCINCVADLTYTESIVRFLEMGIKMNYSWEWENEVKKWKDKDGKLLWKN